MSEKAEPVQSALVLPHEKSQCLGVIRTPERVTNIAWGDEDLKSLYMTGITALYRTRVRVPGQLTY